jgi:hypothetical protein
MANMKPSKLAWQTEYAAEFHRTSGGLMHFWETALSGGLYWYWTTAPGEDPEKVSSLHRRRKIRRSDAIKCTENLRTREDYTPEQQESAA